MAGEVFYLKYRDTRPVLDVFLKNPDGTARDLVGTTLYYLNIILSTGLYLQRAMSKIGVDADGHLRYTWIAGDWGATTGDGTKTNPYTAGGLIVGPTLPLAKTAIEHRMEYEVTGAGGIRETFPNDGYDILRIWDDIGQGT